MWALVLNIGIFVLSFSPSAFANVNMYVRQDQIKLFLILIQELAIHNMLRSNSGLLSWLFIMYFKRPSFANAQEAYTLPHNMSLAK